VRRTPGFDTRIGGIALEAGVDAEPGPGRVERAVGPQRNFRVVLGDRRQITIEELVVPIEQRARLVPERAGRGMSERRTTENRSIHTSQAAVASFRIQDLELRGGRWQR
jgi:hypothetical protein